VAGPRRGAPAVPALHLGTTAKPKGILHTTGGYLTQVAYTHRAVFDLKPETDVFWCSADVGWVTGHSYIVYGPLANAATSVMYEGTPDTPHQGRWWEIVERYGVTILYTAPTAIRTFMKWGAEIPAKSDLSSLRLLGSVGESINPEAWMWYREAIGGNRCPIVDTWWQTETGGHDDQPAPGCHGDEAGVGHDGAAGHQRRRGRRRGRAGAERRGRLPGPHRAVAGDAARHLGRRRALQEDLLVPLRERLLRRRRRQEGRRRGHLAPGPGRRRHERVRATGSPPPRWSPPWCPTPRSPRRPSSARRTR
jgi:acetyl-CoA synthetase